MKSQRTKNTLLKNAQANAKAIFLREYFFSHPKRNSNFFSPTLRCFNFFCKRTVQTWTDITSNVNCFRQSMCWLDNSPLRTDRRASANRGFAKKRVQWLIEHSTSYQILCLVDSFVLRNPLLRKAPNRYAQV